MKVTRKEIKEIVETLPIGYYAKRKVPTYLDNNADCSFYNPSLDEIHISYKQITKGLEPVPELEGEYRESGIRASVYHELSHAILTPNNLEMNDVINIFEDERIETIMKNTYLDVDFKKNVVLINGGTITPPTNILSAFYHLVRYRICPNEDLLNEVDDIIDEYRKLSKNSARYLTHLYYNSIMKLFNKLCSEFLNLPQIPQEELSKMLGVLSDNNDSETDTTEENSENEDFNRAGGNDNGNKILESTFNKYIDNTLTESLQFIINQFNKKNSGGSSVATYSGVFNPRLVGNNNYRYFNRSMNVNGVNLFGTMHLNLFIDCSYSFSPNEDRVNTLISSINAIEKKNKNFTCDVIFCGDGLKETTKDNRFISCESGNRLFYLQTFDIFNHHQLKNTYNYNIVLFDGDCGAKYGGRNALEVFDKNNVSMILEKNNMKYIMNMHSAKIKIVEGNYTDILTNEVLNALQIAFR